LRKKEVFYSLDVFLCPQCFLVQVESSVSPEETFSEYAYCSSYSQTWLEHCRGYAEKVSSLFRLGKNSLVVEVASNDGCLLKFFREAGFRVLGVEPAHNIARVARKNGIPTESVFFSSRVARTLVKRGYQADLVVANNVLAHVPAPHDFVRGLRVLLKPEGVLTVEFPHLMRMIEENQFDTIYHEHLCYFSFFVARRLLETNGLVVFDVERINTHGGSLRIYAGLPESWGKKKKLRVEELEKEERRAGYDQAEVFHRFEKRVQVLKRDLLELLITLKRQGKKIVGYGAPAKGNTLLNYCGIRSDFLDYTVDRNPLKQGRFLPGSHIPVYPPEMIEQTQPDYVLILPWNIKDEIMRQVSYLRKWGGKFIVAIPKVEVL